MALTALLWEIAGISKKGKCKGRKKMISKKCIPGNGRVVINHIMSLLLKMCSRSFFTQSKSQGPYNGLRSPKLSGPGWSLRPHPLFLYLLLSSSCTGLFAISSAHQAHPHLTESVLGSIPRHLWGWSHTSSQSSVTCRGDLQGDLPWPPFLKLQTTYNSLRFTSFYSTLAPNAACNKALYN